MKNIDLKAALDEGIAAFERAESSREQIRQLFESLDETIRTATNSRVSLVVQQVQELARPVSTAGLQGVIEYFKRSLAGDTAMATWHVWSLRTDAPDGTPRVEELFRALIAQHGYPVRLDFLGERAICHDRESLEETLGELLKRPEVGGLIRKLRDATT